MTSLFKDIPEWTIIMMSLLNFVGSVDFKKQLEIQTTPPRTAHRLANSWSLFALGHSHWSNFGMAVGCHLVSRVAIGRLFVSEVDAERLTLQPMLFAKFEAPNVYKREFSPLSSLHHSRPLELPDFLELLHPRTFFQSLFFFFFQLFLWLLSFHSRENGW